MLLLSEKDTEEKLAAPRLLGDFYSMTLFSSFSESMVEWRLGSLKCSENDHEQRLVADIMPLCVCVCV